MRRIGTCIFQPGPLAGFSFEDDFGAKHRLSFPAGDHVMDSKHGMPVFCACESVAITTPAGTLGTSAPPTGSSRQRVAYHFARF